MIMMMRNIFSRVLNLIVQNKILSLILAVALALRFVGVYPGYHIYHSDEGMSYSSAIEMIRNLNIDPTRYDYPSVVPLINMISFVIFFIPLFITKNLIFSPEDLPTKGKNIIELWQQVVIQNQQTDVLFWGRFVTALFGVGVVLLTYLLAKSLFKDRKISLIAAFLVAVNFREVLNSHLGLPDIYNAFFLLLSLLSLSNLLKSPSRKNYIFSGIAVALFFSVKYQVYTIPVFILTHACIVWQKTKNKEFFKLLLNFLNRDFLISIFIIPIIVLILNPYHFIHWDKFQDINSYNLLKYKVGIKVFNFYPISYLYHIGIGQLISYSVLLGVIFSLLKYKFRSLILLIPTAIFFLIFTYYTGGGYYIRNFVSITPLLLILAAVFLVLFWDYFAQKINLNKYLVTLCLAVSAIFVSWNQIENSFITAKYFTKPWGYLEAHDFASLNIPENSNIVSHPWDKYPRDKNLNVIPLEPSTTFSIPEMRDEGANFGFINLDWLSLSSYWWMNKSTKESLDFWEKPNDLLRNTDMAVAAREVGSFSIAEFVKPWQAPDMNIIIIKVPPKTKIQNKVLQSNFSFNTENDLSGWTLIDGDEGKASRIYFDPETGKSSTGSLKFKSGARYFPIIRAVSAIFPVEQSKAIILEGWIRSGSLLDKKSRDGVLRIDFYESDPGQVNLRTKSLASNVSPRFFGSADWTKLELTAIPPKKAKFMTVGVQVNGNTDFWFDDISLYHSVENIEDPRTEPPFIDYQIPDDILFPYSQGAL